MHLHEQETIATLNDLSLYCDTRLDVSCWKLNTHNHIKYRIQKKTILYFVISFVHYKAGNTPVL